jgi:UDP-N-acetylmuramate: L-alanyl-gamma-D-glutamyl-meso-diaminopimelate ligase
MYVYIIGICGTGVGALAGLLKRQGHDVSGSDENVYPPMSDKLREWGIPILKGYDTAHLARRPDLVIIGNVIRAQNPEAVHVREHGLKHLSMPQAVAEFGIRDRHSIVIAGTHGKTTTTALAAHVLLSAGRDPSFLVGGALVGYPESFRAADGDFFVIEGDEYDTAYFDKGSKFLHYRARTAVITSLEFDHADIFDSIEAVERAFLGLIKTVPDGGHLVVWKGAQRAVELARAHQGKRRLTIYSEVPDAEANLSLAWFRSGPEGLVFEPVQEGRSLGEMRLPLWGQFSAQNVLAVIGGLRDAELSPDELRAGLASFRGVKRRLEVRGEPAGVTVVDDFGHHPTAVKVTLEAARTRWPGRRLWALFEPRSATSRRNVFQAEFVDGFALADEVIIGSHERLGEIDAAQRFSPEKLATDLRARGRGARAIAEVERIVDTVASEAKRGDVVLVFSNGSFGGLHDKLLARLAAGPEATRARG